MKANDVLSRVEQLVTPILDDLGMELVHPEYRQEGRDWVLRLFVDKPGGVTLDDCVAVSREVDAILEVEEVIHRAYRLEVSSPGLDRPLLKPGDYERFAGEWVKIKVRERIDPDQRGHLRKTFSGVLLGIEGDVVTIEQQDKRGGKVELKFAEIEQANLDPQF